MSALPLADAALRLRRPPGRPQKAATEAGSIDPASLKQGEKEKAAATRRARKTAAAAAITPRLLDLEQGAKYLSCSPWTLRDLIANGTLPRVRVPLPGGADLRKVLLDREDLDRLIASWKDAAGR